MKRSGDKNITETFKRSDGCIYYYRNIGLDFRNCLECPFPKCRFDVSYITFKGWVAAYLHNQILPPQDSGKRGQIGKSSKSR